MSGHEVFPLRLASFEEYFVVDDSPQWPASFFCKLSLSGHLNRRLAQQAVDKVTDRHPMSQVILKQNLRRRNNTRYVWCQADGQNLIRWSAQVGESGYPTMPPLDPTHEFPLRVHCVDRGESHDVIFQVHHAAFDGLGSFQLLADWLAIYHSLNSGDGKQLRLRKYSNESLKLRCRRGQSFRQCLKLLGGQWRSLRAIARMSRRQAIPLVHENPEVCDTEQTPLVSPNVITRRLDSGLTSKLRDEANKQSTTVNNLVICDLFLAIQRWQTRHLKPVEGTHFRLMIPMNERRIQHRRMPGCNHCTMINIDRSGQEIDSARQNPDQLHEGIRREMSIVERWQLSLNWWSVLSLVRRFPGGIKRFMSKNSQCKATCVLTNLGDLPQRIRGHRSEGRLMAGDLLVDDIELTAPIRPGTSAAFAVFYYQDRLCMSMHYDARVLSGPLAEDLVGTLVEILQGRLCPQTSRSQAA